jgi:hypothetical protein
VVGVRGADVDADALKGVDADEASEAANIALLALAAFLKLLHSDALSAAVL